MRKVNIGTNFVTEVLAMDDKEFNANHHYVVKGVNGDERVFAEIHLQKGPVRENGINGCHHEDLIEIAIDRLQSFQDSEWACRENAIAITKLEEALMWLDKRTQQRMSKGIEGTSQK